jgi:signal transduction histidine kinase
VSRLGLSGWAGAAVLAVCAAVGLWHHRRDAARVARCAHELRGSLGALRLGLDLALARGGLSSERLGALDLQLARAAAALNELDGPAGPGALLPVPVAALLADAVASLEPLAAERGADLRLTDAPDAIVLGDRGRLAQAVGNLIANAIEHGGRTIWVGGRVGEGDVRLEVHDDGPGLSERRSRGGLRRSRGGLRRGFGAPVIGPHGHGLSISADVAAAHGGRLLSVPSGVGLRIVLELPLYARAAAAAALSS